MISYPLREYVSSKKNDDYDRPHSFTNYPSYSTTVNSKSSPPETQCHPVIWIIAVFCLSVIGCMIYTYRSHIDPTCFNTECTNFICEAYTQGLIGGHLCPALCTTKTIQLQHCLGEHKHFRSRMFDDGDGNQVIRCYLTHPLSQSRSQTSVKDYFNFPEDDSTLDIFHAALRQHIIKTLTLRDPDVIIEQLLNFCDFNKDGRISLAEARSLWSLVQIDEFLHTMLLSSKVYTPKITGTCGHVFALEKVQNPNLPFGDNGELVSTLERPNWYQRVRLAMGIIEFVSDTWHHEDSDEHLHLCSPLLKSFGYIKDYESKMLKLNHIISSTSLIARLPTYCKTDSDCFYDSHCHGSCNISKHTCQIKQLHQTSLNQLCSVVSSLVLPDANATFRQNFDPLLEQCRQVVNDRTFNQQIDTDSVSLQVRHTLVLQDLANLLWTQIEYQMGKITKKSTKKPIAPP